MNRSPSRLLVSAMFTVGVATAAAGPLVQEAAHAGEAVAGRASPLPGMPADRAALAGSRPADAAAASRIDMARIGLPAQPPYGALPGVGRQFTPIGPPVVAAGGGGIDNRSFDMQVAQWGGTDLMLASTMNQRMLDASPQFHGDGGPAQYPAAGATQLTHLAQQAVGTHAGAVPQGTYVVDLTDVARGHSMQPEPGHERESSQAVARDSGPFSVVWRWLRTLRAMLNGG